MSGGVGGVSGGGWGEVRGREGRGGARCTYSQVDNEGVADALQNVLFTNDVFDLF